MNLTNSCMIAGKNILVTGGNSGRLGPKIAEFMRKKTKVITTSSHKNTTGVHLPMTLSKNEMKSKIKGSHIVVHSAAISSGPYNKMYEVNVLGTKKIAQACKELNVPLLYLSTTATLANDLSPDVTPYAHTKRESELHAQQENDATIVRLGAILGDNKTPLISLPFMAGVKCKGIPAISIRVPDRPIQPTDYDSTILAVGTIIKSLLNDEKVDDINIVGDSISLHKFLDLIQNDSLVFNLAEEDLKKLSELINNGVFTSEFIELSKKDIPVMDNSKFKQLVGSQFKTPEEVAIAAKCELSIKKALSILITVMGKKPSSEQKQIISEIICVLYKGRSKER